MTLATTLNGIPIGPDGLVDEIDQSQYKVKALLEHKADVEVISPTVLLLGGCPPVIFSRLSASNNIGKTAYFDWFPIFIKATFVRWLVIAIMFGSGVKLVFDGLSRLGVMQVICCGKG